MAASEKKQVTVVADFKKSQKWGFSLQCSTVQDSAHSYNLVRDRHLDEAAK